MVRKGSPVRVRWRAFHEDPANAGSLLFQGQCAVELPVQYRSSSTGPVASVEVDSRRIRTGVNCRSRDVCGHEVDYMTDHEQLSFDELVTTTPEEPRFSVEYLTIAEAARRVRCCERTIRRAIESGDLPAGRVRGGGSTR